MCGVSICAVKNNGLNVKKTIVKILLFYLAHVNTKCVSNGRNVNVAK